MMVKPPLGPWRTAPLVEGRRPVCDSARVRSRHPNAILAAALVASLAICGCTAGQDGETDSGRGNPASGSPAPGEATSTAATTVIPDSSVGRQARWVLQQLEPEADGPTSTEGAERFAPSFLDQVPATRLAQVFAQVRAGGPYRVTEVTRSGPEGSLRIRLAGPEPVVMSIAVDEEDRIQTLLFRPDEPLDVPDVDSWAGLDRELADHARTRQVFVGDVTEGRCERLHTTEGTPPEASPMPSGSVFKLVVLSVLVDAVATGDLAWDDELTVTAELKSLPSGRLQDAQPGTRVTVRRAARLMIRISDNTATDMLIDALGTRRLEEALPRFGVDRTRLRPFLTTRTYFLLGWGAPDVRAAWADAGTGQRRQLLDRLPDAISAVDPGDVTTPVWTAGVGWFLTGQEICTVHARLQQQADTAAGAPVRDVLSDNTGIQAPASASYIGFKGGSAPGVLALSHYLERDGEDAGQGRVLVVQAVGDAGLDQRAVLGAAQAGLNLLARRD